MGRLNQMEQVRAWLRRLMSYRKSTWGVEDYPVRFLKQDADAIRSAGRRTLVRWTAQVINWWQMAGYGETKAEALADLRASFASFRESHDRLPRPGTGAPLEFASSSLIERHETLARDFLARALGLNYDECFISDESSLWDFHGDDGNDVLFRKIFDLYGVDVSSVDGAKLGGILERIARHSEHHGTGSEE